jgi:hypothetical protein
MNKLPNYLMKLIKGIEVKNDSPICMWGIEDLIKQIYDKIKLNYNNSLVKLIVKSFDIGAVRGRTFYQWVDGTAPIPIHQFIKLLTLWKRICNKSDFEVQKIIDTAFLNVDSFSVRRGKRIKLPKEITVELAYFIGQVAGDGHLLDIKKEKQRTGDYEFRITITTNSMSFVNSILKPLTIKLFGIDGKIYKYKNRNACEFYISSKVLYTFLTKVCELPIGRKKGKLKIPSVIMKSNEDIKYSFIAGFLDADGWISIKNKRIGFAQADRRIVKNMKKLFESLGIKTRKITKDNQKYGVGWEFSVKSCSIKDFITRIPLQNSSNLLKIKKLQKVTMI